MAGNDEASLKQEIEKLQRALSRKNEFEHAVSSLKSLLAQRYSLSSHSTRRLFYSVVCRVATVLKTRHTSPGFWHAGLGLFELAETLISDPSEKDHVRACIAQSREILHALDSDSTGGGTRDRGGGYLFEGHLTVDPEPPQPQWLVQSNLLNSVATLVNTSQGGDPIDNSSASSSGAASVLLQELVENLDTTLLPEILENDTSAAPKAPPASKEVVASLPVITLTDEILAKLGRDARCSICQENLVLDDKMQELPCKHNFHPSCVKPWLDEHNSCPICRHELQTDDHAYESWKEREKELEEERKGAANAIRGGEYMYV